MLTQTAKYAIKALLHLARQANNGYCQTREIAELANIPANYLGKIMQKLAHAQILDSQKGLHGGFRLGRSADAISMFDILIAIEAIPRDLADRTGEDDPEGLPSGVYARIAEMTRQYIQVLRQTTLAELLASSQTAPAEPMAAVLAV